MQTTTRKARPATMATIFVEILFAITIALATLSWMWMPPISAALIPPAIAVVLGCLYAIVVNIVRIWRMIAAELDPESGALDCRDFAVIRNIDRDESRCAHPECDHPQRRPTQLQAANPLALYPWSRSRAEAMAYARSPFDYDRARPKLLFGESSIALRPRNGPTSYSPQYGAIIRGPDEKLIWNVNQSLQSAIDHKRAQAELSKMETALQSPHLGPTDMASHG
jgi:hypothetical protein